MNDILNKIIAECPKAWGEWCKSRKFNYAYPEMEISLDGNIIVATLKTEDYDYLDFNFRNWYDYFDGLKIYIHAYPRINKETGWNALIEHKSLSPSKFLAKMPTRTEAEWSAFLEAFKIREGQL